MRGRWDQKAQRLIVRRVIDGTQPRETPPQCGSTPHGRCRTCMSKLDSAGGAVRLSRGSRVYEVKSAYDQCWQKP